jgi:hypothetical protein
MHEVHRGETRPNLFVSPEDPELVMAKDPCGLRRLQVTQPAVCHWKNSRSKSGVSFIPAIIRFLGYDPQPPSDTWAERLLQGRTALGLTQSAAAARIGVDACTLTRCEPGEGEPEGGFATRAFVTSVNTEWAPAVAQSA